jgi:hypothetical protein
MNNNQPSFLRDLIGFIVGALVAAATAGLVFVLFYPPLPESNPNRHDRAAALAILIIVMFFSGGFIGRRGFSADFLSDLRWPVVGSYIVVVFLYFLASFSLGEIATMVGFATAGVLSSAIASLILLWRFPVKGEQ